MSQITICDVCAKVIDEFDKIEFIKLTGKHWSIQEPTRIVSDDKIDLCGACSAKELKTLYEVGVAKYKQSRKTNGKKDLGKASVKGVMSEFDRAVAAKGVNDDKTESNEEGVEGTENNAAGESLKEIEAGMEA